MSEECDPEQALAVAERRLRLFRKLCAENPTDGLKREVASTEAEVERLRVAVETARRIRLEECAERERIQAHVDAKLRWYIEISGWQERGWDYPTVLGLLELIQSANVIGEDAAHLRSFPPDEPAPTWSRTPPQESGWYWTREPGFRVCAIEFFCGAPEGRGEYHDLTLAEALERRMEFWPVRLEPPT